MSNYKTKGNHYSSYDMNTNLMKVQCDGKNPCQTCQSKGLVCEYDSASDPGDRRKFRASAREYNDLLQQRAILEDLCHAIRLGVADEALQRIREGASPLDIVELLNTAIQNSISDSTDFSSAPRSHGQQRSFQQALESNTPYQMPWYDDTGQINSPNTDPDLQQPETTPSFTFTATQAQESTEESASWQMQSTWHSSSQVHGESSEQLPLGRKFETTTKSDVTRSS